MKVLAINFSPNKEAGNTYKVLSPFLEGMAAAGGEVELLNIADLRIERCQGCFDCQHKTLGVCRLADDLSKVLLEKAKAADCWVFAMPLYGDTAPGIFEDALLRLIMLQVQAIIEKVDGHFRHPLRYECAPHKVVFVATSGYPDSDRYAPLWQHLENYCTLRANLLDFKGIVFRPCGAVYSYLLELKEEHALAIEVAAKRAGEALVRRENISEADLALIRQPLIDDETLLCAANERHRRILAALASA